MSISVVLSSGSWLSEFLLVASARTRGFTFATPESLRTPTVCRDDLDPTFYLGSGIRHRAASALLWAGSPSSSWVTSRSSRGAGYLVGQVWDLSGEPYTTRAVILQMWIPLEAALVFTYVIVAAPPGGTSSYARAVPIIFAVWIALAIDYVDLLDKDLGYILALLVATQLVGWSEEGMFRGIGIETLRSHGLSEGRVALWSSIVFGAVHISNALTGDLSQALPQAIAVSFAGSFFHLIRRASRGNVLNSIIHGMFDFSIITGTAIAADQCGYRGTAAAILAYLIAGTLLIVRRHRIEPAPTATT